MRAPSNLKKTRRRAEATYAGGRGAALALATLGTLADDCSDSDFNARLSPQRRNAVLKVLCT